MNSFIENNKSFLKVYCLLARSIGWSIMILGGVGVMIFIVKLSKIGIGEGVLMSGPLGLGIFQRSWFILMTTGLTALGVAQFIRYLFDRDYQGGWILRNGQKILWAFALLVLWKGVSMVFGSVLRYGAIDSLLFVLSIVLFNAGKVLVLIGLAQILRRVMAVVEESKTLV